MCKRKALIAGLVALSSLAVSNVYAAAAAAIDVTDFTGTLSNQQTSVVAVVGAGFVLLGIVVGVRYIRRAAK